MTVISLRGRSKQKAGNDVDESSDQTESSSHEPKRRSFFGRKNTGPAPEKSDRQPDTDGEQIIRTISHTHAERWKKQALLVLLVAVVALGPTSAVMVWTKPTTTATVVSSGETAKDANTRQAASAFAANFVVKWLTATDTDDHGVSDHVASDSPVTYSDTPAMVDHPLPVSAHHDGKTGVWNVTVAVDVKTKVAHPDHGQPGHVWTTRYFRVPILAGRNGTVMAETLPAAVAAPRVVTGKPLDYSATVSSSSAVSATVESFLGGLLAGHDDVTRLTSPVASIRAVTPAPYDTVNLESLAATTQPAAHPRDGAHVRVLATATGITGDRRTPLQYVLTLKARADRWEISALDPAPAIEKDTADDSTQVTPSERTNQ